MSKIALLLLGICSFLLFLVPYLIHIDTQGPSLAQSREDFLHPPPRRGKAFGSVTAPFPSTIDRDNLPPYHMVFSTSCSDQQHWESFVFFYHAYKVGQPGTVTRIVSGCDDRKRNELQAFHDQYIRTMSDKFEVHFTLDYSRIALIGGKVPYKYMNKPFGLRHWFEHRLDRSNKTVEEEDDEVNDGIVMLLDPDMILLRPLYHDFSDVDNHLFVEEKPRTRVVKHGYPISQHDGYLNNEWMKLNMSYITGQPEGAYVPLPPGKDGPVHWNTGPPYLATLKDFYRITVRWTEYAPRVFDVYPKLFAEMFGMIHATVQLELPFTTVKSIVVSDPSTTHREGWPLIDDLPDDQVCAPAVTSKLPIGLHYCKRYVLGENFFSKYRIKASIMDCNQALNKEPSDRLYPSIDYQIYPPKADMSDMATYRNNKKRITPQRAKREQFMLCRMVLSMNEALRYHKTMKCGATANLNQTYSVYDDPRKFE